nr:MAG TPA: hypothetical protein [Bacteriophage sp.]
MATDPTEGLIILGSCNFEWNIPSKLSSFQ